MIQLLKRLLREDIVEWERTVRQYEKENRALPIPKEITVETLHQFNTNINDLFTKASYDYARSKSNLDTADRMLDIVLKEIHEGKTDAIRKALAVEFAKNYPNPFDPEETVDLFEIYDIWNRIFNYMQATMDTLRFKADAKITSNSLLKLERDVL